MSAEDCCMQRATCRRNCAYRYGLVELAAEPACCGQPEICTTRGCPDRIDYLELHRLGIRILSSAAAHVPMPPGTAAAPEPPKPVNPKDGIGSTKLPLHLWPESATAHGCLALLDGMLKYGRLNWRGTEVRASVYYSACRRHLGEWMEGQTRDAKTGLHPLAHALACIAIILDAEAAGTLIDDRNYPGGYNALVEQLTPHVARLQTLYADVKAPHHWTILDTIVSGDENG